MPIADAKSASANSSQYAALCWRRVKSRGKAGVKSGKDAGSVEVLLITSRDTGRWVLPKGWPMKGMTPAEAAAREAYEEAGVEGRIDADPIGDFRYIKVLPGERGIPCRVAVFPLRVKRLLDSFPECDQRERAWFSPAAAAEKVDEPQLKALLRDFAP